MKGCITMKKLLLSICAVLVCASLVIAFAACGSETVEESSTEESSSAAESTSESDLEYVVSKGTLVVGITDFEPMDYKDDDGNWIGFDADLATAFAEYLGVEIEFVEIDWDNKVLELNATSVDCIWNGMTLTDEVLSAMECSYAYLNNAQIVVLSADIADDYTTVEELASLTFAVESGSAGAAAAEENGFTYTEVSSQANALMEVAAGTSDAAIIDSLMAAAMVGEGTSYEDLTYTVSLTTEEYGVGFRSGSDLADALNEFLVEAYEDGTIAEIAETYGVTAALVDLSVYA